MSQYNSYSESDSKDSTLETSTVIFINDKACKIEELLLNEDWELEKLFDRIYNIIVNGKKLDWIVKIYKEEKYVRREYEILKKLEKVEKIPRILAVNFSPQLNYIIISKAKGQDLYEYMYKNGTCSEKEVKKIIFQLLQILEKIHAKDIIHKDIKPENIIYDKNTKNITLIDFEGKQTNDYKSPEQLKGEITIKSDIWAVGITCYFLLTGVVPFENETTIKRGRLLFRKKWSLELKDFIGSLLEREQAQRYSAKEALNHMWFMV